MTDALGSRYSESYSPIKLNFPGVKAKSTGEMNLEMDLRNFKEADRCFV